MDITLRSAISIATISVTFQLIFAATGAAIGQERYETSTFSDYTNDSLNISVFVFRDLNRNGSYDVGDRPMSGISVDATGNRRTITRYSNMSGFTNFEMSATDASKDITFAGEYEFQVDVPRGWSITTENGTQRVYFSLLPSAPADIVADPPPSPVGLVPDLTVAGTASPNLRIEAVSPSGKRRRISADDTGHYGLAASPGTWHIKFFGPGASETVRAVEVATAPVVLSYRSDAGGPSTDVPTATVTFDDLDSAGVSKIPSGYRGLQWDNFVMAHMKFYGSNGYRNNIMSGEFVAYNGSGHPASIFSEQPFDFIGGYLGASNSQAEGETLHVTAWRGDVVVHEEDLKLSALGPIFYAADLHGVTRLDFATAHYWQVTFDDLAFRLANQ
jgi:hypothetical protein